VSVEKFRRDVEKLEEERRQEQGAEDEAERERRLEAVREAAEQENERFYRGLAIERRTAFLDSVGYEGHTAEDLRDENFLYSDDSEAAPFTITEAGEVFCTRDGKPVTTYPQTLAEVWYWRELLEWGTPGLIHDEESEAFFTPDGELALSRHVVNLQHYLNP
jgi:hypothetical protein